jgi:hypothetical protein
MFEEASTKILTKNVGRSLLEKCWKKLKKCWLKNVETFLKMLTKNNWNQHTLKMLEHLWKISGEASRKMLEEASRKNVETFIKCWKKCGIHS